MSKSKTMSTVAQAEALAPDAIMQLGCAFWGSKTLLSAVELKLFAALSEAGPLAADEGRRRAHLNAYVAQFGLADRLSFTPGDFFADPLPSADVLIMGHILHDWDLDQKRLLLQKAYAALPKAGALIVYEAMIDDDRRENAFGLLMSLNMLIEGHGFDYTGADCRGWMAEAGFSESRVEPLVGPDSMVVGIK